MNPHLWMWIAPLALVLMLADWRQTVRIFAPGSKWRELNPLINRAVQLFGAPLGVHLWFAAVIVLVAAAVALIPSTYKMLLLTGCVLMEAYWVWNNLKLGIRIF